MSSVESFQLHYDGLSPIHKGVFAIDRLQLLERYFHLVIDGNQIQNLTRIVDRSDFWDSNVLDLLMLCSITRPIGVPIDIGSGGGVPGLLYEIVTGVPVILLESERLKADFLQRTIQTLGLSSTVQPIRAEKFFRGFKQPCWLLSRATGSVTKLWGWTSGCSTWNTIFLFKSLKWPEEWSEFQSLYPRKLRIEEKVDYFSGPEKRFRTIVRLERDVPRGT